jgi:hypothetical protein
MKPTEIIAHCGSCGATWITDLARANVHVLPDRNITGTACPRCHGSDVRGGQAHGKTSHSPDLPEPVLITGADPQADDPDD